MVNKKIAILGFAFKENTNDTRESPSIEMCKNLLNEGAFLKIHDYKVSKETILKDLTNKKKPNTLICSYHSDVYDALEDSHAAIIMTEWDLYKSINWEKILPKTKQPFWIFDTRLALDSKEIKSLGINLWQLGYGNNK